MRAVAPVPDLDTHGICPHCLDRNPYTEIVCSGCGARLPWADNVLANRQTAPPTIAVPAPAAVRTLTPSPAGADMHAWGRGTPPTSPTIAPAPVKTRRGRMSLAAAGRAALAGAAGGLAGFVLGDALGLVGEGGADDLITLIETVGLWGAVIGACMGLVILANDNVQSLRGRWYRDLLPGLPLFAAAGFSSAAAAQAFYSLLQNSLTRGLGWACWGIGVGAAIGMVRRDIMQVLRGALGGGIGGFIGGFIFNSLGELFPGDNGAFSRAVGLVITGAMIALLIRVVQDALKSAWLVGISTGYEGKEYPLNKARVTVGRADSNDISLYRNSELAMQSGAFVYTSGGWTWRGDPVEVNGTLQSQAVLHSDDTVRLGGALFFFRTRS